MAGGLGLTFTIGASVGASVASAFASVNDKIKATQQSFRNASRQSRQLSQAAAAGQKRNELAALAKSQMQTTGKIDQSLRRELQKVSLAYAEAAKKAGVYGHSLAEITRRQRQMAASVEQSQKRLQNLNRIQAAKNAMQSEKDVRGKAVMSAFSGVAAGLAMAAPLKIGMDFEASMSEVKAISGATGQAFADLRNQARQLGATTVWSAKEAAQGMKFLSMAGFNTNQTMAAMPGMLSLASAGAMDLASTADIASNVLSGFGMEAEQMNYVADVMAKTFTKSNTSISSIGESMKYCAPAAKAASQSFQDVAAMIGKLGDAGIQGSMAGTSLNAILTRMAAPPKAAATSLAMLGINVADAEGKIRPMPDLMREMAVKTSQMTEEQRLFHARNIFGMQHMKSGLVLMESAMTGSLQQMSKSLYEKGYAEKVAKEQTDNFMGDLKALNSASEEVAICFYDTVSPALRQITQGIIPAVQATGEWIKANPRLTQGIMVLGGAFVALKAGGLAFTFLNSYRKSFTSGLTVMRGQAREAVFGVTGAFGKMRSELMRPVSVSFSGAQAGASNFRARLNALAASARRVTSSLRNIGPAAIAAGTKAAISGSIAATGRVGFNMLRLGVKGVGMAFKTAFGPMSLMIMGLSMGAEYIMEHWEDIQPWFQALWEGVKSVFNAVSEWIRPVFEKIMSFVNPLINGVKKVCDIIGRGWDAIFGSSEDERKKAEEAPKPEEIVEPMQMTAEEQAQAQKYAHARENAEAEEAKKKGAKKKSKKKSKKDRKFERMQEMAEETGDDYGENLNDLDPDDVLPASYAPPKRPVQRKQALAASQQTEIMQPQIQVDVNVTQNGIPDADFATGVINAIKAKQSELEAMITAIVNEQARLAYG